jgi:hypothetical protein
MVYEDVLMDFLYRLKVYRLWSSDGAFFRECLSYLWAKVGWSQPGKL